MTQIGTVITVVLAGVALSIAGVPLRLKKVPPNDTYGFRVPSTLSNPAVWYETNSQVGTGLIVVGSGLALVGGAGWVLQSDKNLLAVISLAWLSLGMLGTLVNGARAVEKSLGREAQMRSASKPEQ